MLRTLKDLFDTALRPVPVTESLAESEHALQLATAVLLVEVMRSDPEVSAAERQAVLQALRAKFTLADDELERLVELAEQAARDAHDYRGHTSRVNQGFTFEQKVKIVEYMWQVAYADGHLTAHEKHVLWRLADLLHVPHRAYINATIRARQAAGLDPQG